MNIGSGPPGSKVRWFRSASNEPRFINTVTFEKADAPTIVLVHGYAAAQGFFFRNFDALASQFRVIAIDQLGCGASSRPDFTCKTTEGTHLLLLTSVNSFPSFICLFPCMKLVFLIGLLYLTSFRDRVVVY